MPGVDVKVSADSSGVKTGLAQAQQHVEAFKESAKESIADIAKDFAGMFAAGAILEGLKGVFEQFARIGELSKQAGESAEDFQRVAQVAEKTNVDMEMLSKSIKNVTVAAVEALEGSKEMAGAFDDLGISAADFVDLPITEKVEMLADAYNTAGSNAIKVEAINKLLSRGGKELIPVLEEGSEALKAEFASANVASDETVENIEKADETFKSLWTNIKVFGADSIGFVIIAFQQFVNIAAVAIAYLENIPKGFKAAKAAAKDMMESQQQDYAAAEKKKQDLEDSRKGQRGKTAETAAKKDLAEQQAEAEKKSVKEIAALQAENDKKKMEYYEAHISLAEKELEIKKRLADLNASENYGHGNSQEQLLKNDNERLDLVKQLESVQDTLRKASLEKDKEAAKQKAKAELDAEKNKLTSGEELLKSMEEKYKPLSVDSLKSVGGNLSRVNYNAILPRQNAEKEAIEHQKKAVEELKKIVKNTESIKPPILFTTNDGSFGA